MMLGLLLARAGVEVTVLEKHGDFLWDFRGDTVHPSTLRLLDELGLGRRFAELPARRLEEMRIQLGRHTVTMAGSRWPSRRSRSSANTRCCSGPPSKEHSIPSASRCRSVHCNACPPCAP